MNKAEMVDPRASRSEPSKAVARDVVVGVFAAVGDTPAKIAYAEIRRCEKKCCPSVNLRIERTLKWTKVVHAV